MLPKLAIEILADFVVVFDDDVNVAFNEMRLRFSHLGKRKEKRTET